MVVVFGGSYNGKLDYSMKKFNLKKDDIFYCSDDLLKFDKVAISGLHIFIKNYLKNNESPLDYLQNNIEKLKDKIIICDEINSGIVPMDNFDRVYREEYGQSIQFLCKNAEEVYRIFFGLEERLK